MAGRPAARAESRRRLLALRAGRQPSHQRARLPAPRPGAVEPARVPLRARPPDAIARAPHDPALARRPAPRAGGAGPRPAPDREVRRLQRAARRRARPLRGRVARGGLARSRGARRPAPASLGRRSRARPDRGPLPARPRARLRGGLGEHLPHRAASTRPSARRVRPGIAPDRHPDPRRCAAGGDTLARWPGPPQRGVMDPPAGRHRLPVRRPAAARAGPRNHPRRVAPRVQRPDASLARALLPQRLRRGGGRGRPRHRGGHALRLRALGGRILGAAGA